VFQLLIAKLFRFRPVPVPPPSGLDPRALDAVLDAVRVELERPAIVSANEPRKIRRDRIPARTSRTVHQRRYSFHDLEVGECSREPIRARNAVHNYGYNTGKKFTTTARSNGLWVRRVA
jgi:hypothetical protein